jgi:hypothetical protein
VIKTVAGGVIPVKDPPLEFEFQIREGATPTEEGNILETKTATAGAATLEFDEDLKPGNTYQLCEVLMVGWSTSLGDFGTVFVPGLADDPLADNSVNCVDFTVTPGQLRTFNIDNDPPPVGNAHTIGFWKNWTSCDGHGHQRPVLDYVLWSFGKFDFVDAADTPDDASVFAGLFMGFLDPSPFAPGVNLGNLNINNCLDAVSILDKRSLDRAAGKKNRGPKAAGDPAFNMAAQLLAVKLNLQAGAYDPDCIYDMIAEADALLIAVQFNGVDAPVYAAGPAGAAQKARLNYLNGLLDDYNNNDLDCSDYVPLP